MISLLYLRNNNFPTATSPPAVTKDKIESFMPIIDGAIEEGLATLEKVEIRIYRAGEKDEAGE
jgi:hypothetical protein